VHFATCFDGDFDEFHVTINIKNINTLPIPNQRSLNTETPLFNTPYRILRLAIVSGNRWQQVATGGNRWQHVAKSGVLYSYSYLQGSYEIEADLATYASCSTRRVPQL